MNRIGYRFFTTHNVTLGFHGPHFTTDRCFPMWLPVTSENSHYFVVLALWKIRPSHDTDNQIPSYVTSSKWAFVFVRQRRPKLEEKKENMGSVSRVLRGRRLGIHLLAARLCCSALCSAYACEGRSNLIATNKEIHWHMSSNSLRLALFIGEEPHRRLSSTKISLVASFASRKYSKCRNYTKTWHFFLLGSSGFRSG